MRVINITQEHPKYGQEVNLSKGTYTEAIEVALKTWFNNEEYPSYDDPVSLDNGYELEFTTKVGGRYKVRVVK